MDKTKKTSDTYGFLWNKSENATPPSRWHYNAMQEVISKPIVIGARGIEIGSGCGFDAYLMAKNNPGIRLFSMDMSDGALRTKELVSRLDNVRVVRASALDIPFKDGAFDFAYSFGVLHHTDDPEKGLHEIARVLKEGGSVYAYLYEDHSEHPLKRAGVKMASALRRVTVRMPPKALYVLACVLSPVVYALFTLPAKVLRKFGKTATLASLMPFNFGTTPFSLRGDLYDRFGAPIECRYGRQEALDMFIRQGFSDVNITRLKDTAGWVIWGCKA